MPDANRPWHEAIWIALIATAAVTLLLAFGATTRLELPLRDAALRLLPSKPATSTTVVAIDEPSIRQIGHWPWSRNTLAQMIERTAHCGAKAVVLDILLADPMAGDDRLAQAMRTIPTIAVSVLDERGQWLLPAAPLRDAAMAAHGNFEVDRDGIVRRFASTKQSGDRSLTALSLRAASLVTGSPTPIAQSVAPMFRTRPTGIPIISAADLLHNSPRVSGKLVFIGPTALGLGDRFLTPVSNNLDPGVTIHAAATESLIRGEVVHPIPPVAAGPITGVLVAASILARRSRAATLAIFAAETVLIAAGGVLLLEISGVAIPFVILLLSITMATAAIEANRMRIKAARLEDLATRLAEHRAREVESKQLLVHELKTPLASMRNLTQLLAGFELTEAERRRVASLVESEAGKLQSMVHGLLDLERLPLRDFDAASSVVDIGDLVVSRVEFLRASTDRTLSVTREPGLLARVNSALVERIVDNLVGNALKYSPQSAPVSIAVRRGGADILLEVDDRGSGIPEAEREKIFNRFFRGTSAAGTEGLGLGLAFVAEVVRWHGGSVSAGTAPAGGSRFRVTLPAARAQAKAEAV